MISHDRRGNSAIVFRRKVVKLLTDSSIQILGFRAPHPAFFIASQSRCAMAERH